MDFYNADESFDSFEEFQTKKKEITKTLTETHPAFIVKRRILNPPKFSKLSAEERWNFSQKLKELQKVINSIQTEIDPDISSANFTLDEVLEVLNIRRAMQKGYNK